ncbi:uncharacterized protein EAE97_001155 [Botrytis byssoidea]|uniref:Uncharacterized protein n=1 Tax=Botrytis byssoidea TaxID=139641 RepID=A0A9P5ITX8_9HELO|nr:uncharacterized protein EAE97_001155 [Botrytis byssoidea]KAF7953756.1 hypothetical protein EAE97_001155 [Botrytis byssoidea]
MTLYRPFEGTTKEELKLHRPKSPDFLLCHVCGLNSSLQEHDVYFSHVKVSMNSCRGMWSLGEKYFLKERAKHENGDPTKPHSDYAIKQHRTIGTELAEYLAEARKFTSTKPEAPDGKPIRDQIFGAEYTYVDLMTADREEWWARTEPRIRNPSNIPQEKILKFKESYPLKEGAKYVLSL